MSFESTADVIKELTLRGLCRSDITDIISHLADVPYDEARNNPQNLPLDCSKVSGLFEALDKNMPVAYITGRKEFYGYEFKVSQDTLIPRPDTEVLVETVLKNTSFAQSVKITDLYTGSGCILLTLLKELPNAIGVGVDLSPAALKIAAENAVNLGVNERCTFVEADITAPSFEMDLLNVDILTANPPYVSHEEYMECEPSVLFEPHIALEAKDNGFYHYKKLLCALANSGYNALQFYFEVGYNQAPVVQEYASSLGIETETSRDLAGHERVVSGSIAFND